MKKFLLTCMIIFSGLLAFNYSQACAEENSGLELNVVKKFLPWTEKRERLTREYAELHYGKSVTEIEPRAVVIHWTAGPTWESAYYTFYGETRNTGDGSVNVSSQFLADRDGTIYQLMPENKLARHVIGYNWCAVGIENVGGVNNAENLTPEQLKSNIEIIRSLRKKYPEIKYIFGHYQQNAARASGLYIEKVPGYYSVKSDPGKKFMRALKDELEDEGFIFFRI